MKKIICFLFICCGLQAQTPQQYTTFQGQSLSLYAWEGQKIMILSEDSTLNPDTMSQWLGVMDGVYNYYAGCTGHEPVFYTGVTYLDGRSTIAQVPATCGAGCGYLGWTGIELLSPNFMTMYNGINLSNEYDQAVFYEFGRNFWFYGPKLAYLQNDPITTGYAVYMRFKAMEATGVQGAPFNGSLPFADFKAQIKGLLTAYMANSNYTWGNTLGVGQGVPNAGWGASDLFASFCFYLSDTYGEDWVQHVWQYTGQRPDATTTQEAVDNFIIASSQAANTNLIPLFTFWKWPVSQNAIDAVNALGLKKNTKQVGVHPNPVRVSLTIDSPDSIRKIQFFDMLGRLVKTVAGDPAQVIPVNDLKEGIYSVLIITDGGTYKQKIIKK